MPTETGRVIKRKRITLPSGGTVDIPVITQITFLDVVAQGQEYEFHIENSSAAHRDVHVASIPGGGAATDESGGGDSDLKVERIDIWRVLDIVDHGQESFIHFDNKTIKEPPDAPPYFTTHEKTHVVKYINTPDDGKWIRSELIDRFKVLDVVEQGQETEYFLFNPPDNTGINGLTLGTDSDGTTVAVNPGMADIADAVDPVRTDPFQNIVDFSSVPTEHLAASLWKKLPGTASGGVIIDGWELVLSSDNGDQDPAFKQAIIDLIAAGYSDFGTVFENLVTGLVEPEFTGANDGHIFHSFGLIGPAAANPHNEDPPHSLCFASQWNNSTVQGFPHVFVRAYYNPVTA